MDLLAGQAREAGAALLIVTHSEKVGAAADRWLTLTHQGLVPHG
jgi:predicted ABC-type transport system involved in lysophospholipase L1 biosynthesis ATPase subunit